jgi:hypothetical protein
MKVTANVIDSILSTRAKYSVECYDRQGRLLSRAWIKTKSAFDALSLGYNQHIIEASENYQPVPVPVRCTVTLADLILLDVAIADLKLTTG